MVAQGLWIKLVLLAFGLLALHGVQAQCNDTTLVITPENVADVEACAFLKVSDVEVAANVTSLDLSKLITVHSLRIEGDSLQSLLIPNLQSVDYFITIDNIQASVSIEFSSLVTAATLEFSRVSFPALSFPVLQRLSSSVQLADCSGELNDAVFPALEAVGGVNVQQIERPFNISGLNTVISGTVNIGSSEHLTVTGLNGNITASKVELRELHNCIISGFNGLINITELTAESIYNTTFSGFNGTLRLKGTFTLFKFYDSEVSGFNGDVQSSDSYLRRFYNSSVTGFNGYVRTTFALHIGFSEHTFVSGFNGEIDSRGLYLEVFKLCVLSGFNGKVNVQRAMILSNGYQAEISGFNGLVSASTLDVQIMATSEISGFNGNVSAQSSTFKQLYGNVVVSGFNGNVHIRDHLTVEHLDDYFECYDCAFLYLDDYVWEIDNSTLIKFTGFNGHVQASGIYFQYSTSPLQIAGFKGQTVFSGIRFQTLANMTVADGAFASLHPMPAGSVEAAPSSSPSPSPSTPSSSSQPHLQQNTLNAVEKRYCLISFASVSLDQPAETLSNVFHGAQPPDADPAVSYVFSVIFNIVRNLTTIAHSFQGVQSAENVAFTEVPNLAAIQHSFNDLQTVSTNMIFMMTGLENAGLTTSFTSLNSIYMFGAAFNLYLTSVDFLLTVPHIQELHLEMNPALRSIAGLCGLEPRPYMVVTLKDLSALCCADIEAIFDASLYNDSSLDIDFIIQGCNSNASCELGPRHVCECASFDKDLCPQGEFCADVRFGPQCLTCQGQEFFNSSSSKCQDCAPASYPLDNRTSCTACSMFGETCTSCDAAGCNTCAEPSVKINGTCQACSIFGAACTSCNVSGCDTCAQPATNIDGVCRVCDLGCQNNGKCTLSKSGQFCACPAGFGGALCEQKQSFDVVTETKQSTSAPKKRSNFAVERPFVVDTVVAKPSRVTIVDVDLLQVIVSPNGVVLYEPVIGQAHAGQRTAAGTQAALNFTYNVATRNLQVTFSPLASFLGSKSSADIKVKVEFLLSYKVDGSVASSVSKKVAVMRTVTNHPALQSDSDVYTTTITVEQAVTLYPTEEAADEAQNKADQQAAEGSDGLSGGAIAGIVIGSVVGAILLLALGLFCMRRASGNKGSVSQGTELGVVAKR